MAHGVATRGTARRRDVQAPASREGRAVAPEDGPAAAPARAAALFVTRGGFSHINAQLLDALRRVRPDIAFEEIDLARELLRRPAALARCLLGAAGEYGVGSFRSRGLLRHRLVRSRAHHGAVARLLRRRFAGRRFAFTLQTQSLFDAGHEGCPHFIYTDHVAQAWGHGPGGSGPPSDGWLDLEARTYRRARHVFTFGPRIRDLLIEGYGTAPERTSAIGAGASVVPQTPPDTSVERYGRRNVLFVGVEWERKGGPELVAAFERVRERLPDATLTIVGCAPPIDVPGCRVLGRLPLNELERHFQAASCFCMPSRLEPFGVVYLEAMHFALPVVATEVGDVGAIVRHGETGRMTPPGDVDALARALEETLADPRRARTMGLAGLARAQAFTWEAVARRIAAHLPGGDGTAGGAEVPW